MAYHCDLIIIIMVLPLIMIARVYADNPLGHTCDPSGIKHSPSFSSNLNKLMGKFQNNLPDLHYFQDQVTGHGNDNVYGFILCRGDTTIPECKACVSGAVTELEKVCVGEGGAIILYDKCMIRYADIPFFGEVDRSDDFYLFDKNVASNPKDFTQKTKELLGRLVPTCTKAPNRFARGTAPYGGKTIHAMVQCSRDISPQDCGVCLKEQIGELGVLCCDGTEGGRVIGNSCNLRYEMYPFLRN